MKENQPSQIPTPLQKLILRLQLALELSQLQEIISIYTNLLLFLAKYSFLFEPENTEIPPVTSDPARDGIDWWNYCNSNPLVYTDPDGCIDLYFGWIEKGQAGWNDTAIQTKAGYHNWMDPASSVIFNIDHAEIDMGDYTMRFWKGDYASTYRTGLKVSGMMTDNPFSKIISKELGMAGGETGLYNNDGKGLGNDGGSLMTQEEMANHGITGVNLKVNKQDGTTIVEVNDGKLRAWPNGYNLLDNSRKGDLYTETTYLFDSEARANEFNNEFQTNLDESDYENQFRSSVDKNEVTITWGKKNE